MNLVIVQESEVDPSGAVTLGGRRGRHLIDVLEVTPGQDVRMGVLDGSIGTGRVQAVDSTRGEVKIRCDFAAAAPDRSDDTLLLAVSRPVVMTRMLAAATSLGFGRIVLFRSWRVDKAHLHSKVLTPRGVRKALLDGLEQACRTRLPEVLLFPLFKPFVEDSLEEIATAAGRFVAHPTASIATSELPRIDGSFTLAVGPERGLIPYEVDALREQGFTPVHCGPHPLRSETALAVLAGQLDLLRGKH